MFNKDKNKEAKKVVASHKRIMITTNSIPLIQMMANLHFMDWLNSGNKTSSKKHFILKRYEKGKECIIDDNTLHYYIKVKINDGDPFCTYCQHDSCAHVGFTICTMQLFERKGILIGEDENILDLFKD